MSRPVSDALVDHQRRAARIGVTYGLGAYLWWGLVPVYFKAVVRVPALEVLAHRIVWSVLLLTGLLVVQRRWALVGAVMKSRVTAVTLAGTTVLIAVNWFVFIWAVANDQVLQASLGYYVNPLVNVLLGYAFLGERLRRWQGLSVALAAVGVGYMAYGYGQIPWISLILAGSFGFYGLLRKTAKVGALVGLTVETTLLVPLALGYLVYRRGTSCWPWRPTGNRSPGHRESRSRASGRHWRSTRSVRCGRRGHDKAVLAARCWSTTLRSRLVCSGIRSVRVPIQVEV
jgi:chloramphenicol-sensitive protein RarD